MKTNVEPINFKAMSIYKKIPFGFFIFFVSLIVYFVFVPLRLLFKGIAHTILFCSKLFKPKNNDIKNKEKSGAIKLIEYMAKTHFHEIQNKFIWYIESEILKSSKKNMPLFIKIPYMLFSLIVAIILDFVYVLLRYIVKLISELVLSIIGIFIKDYRRDITNKNDHPIIKFFEFFASHHPYYGNDPMIKHFDNDIAGMTKKAQNNRVFIYFILPSLSAFLIFVIAPFIFGVYLSFTDWVFQLKDLTWIGLGNYKKILTDYTFVYSFFRTVQYSIISILLMNVIAFSLALLVTQKLKLRNLYRAGFFMPNLIGGLILGYIWKFIFNNVILDFTPHRIFSYINDANTAMGALVAVAIWQYAGYIMMIYIAALQNVPVDLIEASKIDGAGFWQRLKNITFPLIAQAFTVSLFLTIVTSFKQFDTVYSLTNGNPVGNLPLWIQNMMGETGRSLQVLNLMAVDIYKTGFTNHRMGVAQAKSVLFFLFLLVISIGQVTITKKREVEM